MRTLLALLLLACSPAATIAQALHRTADKAWWATNAVSWASMVADVENSQFCFKDPRCREGNPIYFSPRPSRLRMYAVNAPLTGLMTWLSYRWHREDIVDKQKYGYTARVKWWVPAVANIGIHGAALSITFASAGR